ncbi:MAG: preprotein translocase subunit YajC [Bacteroidota bacterium]
MQINNVLLQAAQPGLFGGSAGSTIIMVLMMVAVFYFFFIRPQAKRTKEQKKFRENLQKGQKVITIGGIHGKIVEIQDTTVTIEVEGQVRLRLEKSAIAIDNSQTIENQQ